MFLNFPKKQRKIWQISAQALKSGQINKAKALSLILWLYGLFNVLKTLYGAFILWFDHFLDSWAEICQIFRWFFGKFKIPKRHSEINWPLVCCIFGCWYLDHIISSLPKPPLFKKSFKHADEFLRLLCRDTKMKCD